MKLLTETFVLEQLQGEKLIDTDKMSKEDLMRLAINDYINSRNN